MDEVGVLLPFVTAVALAEQVPLDARQVRPSVSAPLPDVGLPHQQEWRHGRRKRRDWEEAVLRTTVSRGSVRPVLRALGDGKEPDSQQTEMGGQAFLNGCCISTCQVLDRRSR